MSDSSRPRGLQHTRPPCPLPFLWVCSNSYPLSQWCHNHLILCCPLLLLPSIFLSIRVFSNESVFHIKWPMYWSFSFSINPPNKYMGWISFRIDWFDLLAVQGTLQESSPKSQITLKRLKSQESVSRSDSQEADQKHQFFGFSLLCGLALPSIPDYWKNHSFDQTDLCRKSDVSDF